MPPKQKNQAIKRPAEKDPICGEPVTKKSLRSRSAARKINYKEENSTEDSELEDGRQNKKGNYSDDDFAPLVKLETVTESADDDDDFEPSGSQVQQTAGKTKTQRKGPRTMKGKELSITQPILQQIFKPVHLHESQLKKELDLSDSDSDEDLPRPNFTVLKSNDRISSLSSSEVPSVEKELSAETSKEDETIDLWSQNLKALGVKEDPVKEIANDKPKTNAKKPSRKGKAVKKSRESTSSVLKGEVDVAKLLKLGEKSESGSSSEDDGWEKVDTSVPPVIDKQEEPPGDVQVTVEIEDDRRKKKQFDFQDFVRKKMNRIRKEIQVDLHKASLVSTLAHCYLVNISLNDQTLMAAALSIIPSSHCYPPKRTNITYLEKLVNWYHKRFQLVPVTDYYPYPISDAIGHCIATAQARCIEELVFTLVVLCRSLGLETRLVWSLQPLPLKVDSSELLLRDSKGIKKEGDGTEDSVTAAGSSKSSKKSTKVLINMKNDLNKQKDPPGANAKAVKRPNPSSSKSESFKRHKKDGPKEVDDEDDGRAGKKTFRSKTNCESVEAEAGARSQKRDQCGQSERKTIGETIGISGEEKARAESTKTRATSSSTSTSTARLRTSNRESDSKPSAKGKKAGKESVRESGNPSPERSRESLRRKAALAASSATTAGKNSKYVEDSTVSDASDDWAQEPIKTKAKSRTERKSDTKSKSDTPTKSATKGKGDTSTQSGSAFKSDARTQSASKKESSKTGPKEVSRDKTTSKSKKIISSDSDGDRLLDGAGEGTGKTAATLKKAKTAIDVWLEIYLEDEEQWTSVDVTGKTPKIHCNGHLERSATSPLLYVVAMNADLSWKDVTQRYASSFLSVTRKQRIDAQWWQKLIGIKLEAASRRSRNEDESLEQNLRERPLPTNVGEYKSHPLYALQRHLLKFEAIYPPTAVPLGFIRGEPVYARECVKNLHSRETWLKEAKVVRVGEKPYKIVKARPKWDRQSQKMVTDQPLEIFGQWQVEDYVPPPAVDGKVPRNAYGNVELFLPSMLPKGTTHLQIPGLNKVAKKLGIDCAPAMTGWDYHGGWSHPVYDGFVVCSEHVEALVDAWQAEQEEQERRDREKREKRVYDNWRRLIRGLLIKERLQAKYFGKLEDAHPTADATPAVDADVDAEAAHQSIGRKEEDAKAEAVKSETDAKNSQDNGKGKKLSKNSRTGRRK